MPVDPLLLLIIRGPVLDILDVHFGLDMLAATRCKRAGSYRLYRNLIWFIVTGVLIRSKFIRACTAGSSLWYTHVKKHAKAFTA